jgi:CheY-specific phosphatase CheX
MSSEAEYIKPVVDSIREVFETMMGAELSMSRPSPGHGHPPSAAMVSIEISGAVEMVIGICFPKETAEKAASGLAMMEMSIDDPDCVDALSEVGNMVAGSAKAKFAEGTVSFSCPPVAMGPSSTRDPLSASSQATATIVLPCRCQFGKFSISVIMKRDADAAA